MIVGNREYTTTEIAFIRRNAGVMTSKEIGEALGRSQRGISAIASMLNIKLSHRNRNDILSRVVHLRDGEKRRWREIITLIQDEFGVTYSESGLQRGYQRIKLRTIKNTDPDRLRMLNEIHRYRQYDKLPWKEVQKRIERRYNKFYQITALHQMYKRHRNRLLENEENLA